MPTDERPRGIAGLQGKTPVGAVLTIGRKRRPEDNSGRPGVPINRDQFYLMQVDPAPVKYRDKLVKGGIRPMHPSFQPFNDRKVQRVVGMLVHSHRDDCFEHYLRAQGTPDGKMSPSQRPWCEGNGDYAHRLAWDAAGVETIERIDCPNDECPFRQATRDKPALCKPYARLYFQVRWQGASAKLLMPTPLVKFTTQSWHTTKALLGFFDYLDESAQRLGIPEPLLMGLPFELVLQERTDREQRRFPVARMSPLIDPLQFWTESAERRQQLQDMARPVGALTDRSATTEVNDWSQNQPGVHGDVTDAEVVDEG